MYPSESDEPFEYVHLKGVGKEERDGSRFLTILGLPGDTAIRAQSADDFFSELIEEQDWWGATEKADAEKYQALRQILEEQLESLRVLRVGEVEVEKSIVTWTPN